jgi:hypothetical protein
LSDEASGRKVEHELANRLDTLFDDDTIDPKSSGGEVGDPLNELNSLVMSIEWEITDELMERFVAQVEALKTHFKDDRILVMFLQLLGSLGLYIKTNKGNAHPTAFGLLSSVYASLANAAASGKISASEKKKLLYVELNKYKELKEQLGLLRNPTNELSLKKERLREASGRAKNKSVAPDNNREKRSEAISANHSASITPQQFEAAITTIRQLIRDEFKLLREALGQQSSS